ncbi:hypothetical protein K439DRAFT_1329646, partial [Ramaria rubella]
GCSTKIKQDSDQTPRICPRCHNTAVISAKTRMWFELFFIPLIPTTSSHIWLCSICQWQVPHQPGYEPALPGQGTHHGQFPPPQQPQPVHGYGVGQGK